MNTRSFTQAGFDLVEVDVGREAIIATFMCRVGDPVRPENLSLSSCVRFDGRSEKPKLRLAEKVDAKAAALRAMLAHRLQRA